MDRWSNPLTFLRAFLPLRYLGFIFISRILRHTYFLEHLKKKKKRKKRKILNCSPLSFPLLLFRLLTPSSSDRPFATIFLHLTKAPTLSIRPQGFMFVRLFARQQKKIYRAYSAFCEYTFFSARQRTSVHFR